MHIDWKNVSHLVAAMVGTVVPGVQAAESLAWKLKELKGDEKQQAVVEMVKQTAVAVDATAGRVLIDDKEAEAATRGVIDAVVHLQNVVAKKVGAATT